MDTIELLTRLGVAAACGLLVGLQREHSGHRSAGLRTFGLIGALGALCGLLAASFGPWLPAAGLLAVAAYFVGAHVANRAGEAPGMTTEIAALAVYALGLLISQGQLAAGVVATGAVMLLLQYKQAGRALVERIGPTDIRAIGQFVLIALVIFPLVPNQTFGPYQVLNPYKIWLLVVLIVSVSLTGYVAARWLGERSGALLGGLLGGIISSTATTVSYANRVRATAHGNQGDPAAVRTATVVIMLASAISIARVGALGVLVARDHAATLVPPLAALCTGMLLITAVLWFRGGRDGGAVAPPSRNPAELKTALIFAALYALVLLGIAWAKQAVGPGGMYVIALVSGTTDMDAITLSTAELAQKNQLSADTAWRLIVVAAMANTVFKGGMGAALGGRRLAWPLAVAFGLTLLIGAAALVLF